MADGAGLWVKVRALLPDSEEELSLALSGEVDGCIPPLLLRGRSLLYGAAPPCEAALRRLGDIIRDYAWEKLNAGPWRDVSKAWRQVYAYGCLFGALAEIVALRPLAPAVRLCDMGLLMGASVQDNILGRLVRLLQAQLPHTEQRSAAPSSAKRARIEPPPAPMIRPEDTVPHERCPSLEQFRDRYLIPQKPVVLEGVIDHWPCMKKWSVDYVRQVAGCRTVPIELGSRYTDEEWSQRLMTVNDFINRYIVNENSAGYLAQHQLFDQGYHLESSISPNDT